jgi:hypothetical protein
MKLIIAGGRDYKERTLDYEFVSSLLINRGPGDIIIHEVVSGTARGADTWGEMIAGHHGVPIVHFPADWDKFGKSAGHIRNNKMAQYADAVVLLPGGKGTESMYKEAKHYNLIIFDLRGEWNV